MVYGCSKPGNTVIPRSLLYGCPPNIDHLVDRRVPALSLASRRGTRRAVGYILQRQADVNRKGPDGRTALTHALDSMSMINNQRYKYRYNFKTQMSLYAETRLRLLNAGANPNCLLPESLLRNP